MEAAEEGHEAKAGKLEAEYSGRYVSGPSHVDAVFTECYVM